MTKYVTGLVLAIVAGVAPLTAGAADPPGAAMDLLARGVQIYTCTVTSTGAAWKLKGVEATLRDAAGRIVGQHVTGPTWQAPDGSKVVGEPVVASPSPNGGALPWLVLHATRNEGSGVFARVAYVARTRTVGGMPRATGCDAGHSGAESRVEYSATYTFFTPVAP
jgi:Protein of unknown function (DUF3455)